MDFWLFQQINNFAGQYMWLDTLGIFFAKYFGFVLIFCLFLFLYKPIKKAIEYGKGRSLKHSSSILLSRLLRSSSRGDLFRVLRFDFFRSMVFQAILAGVVSRLFFTEIIRFIIPRNRPFVENDVYQLLHHSVSSSFPSGHAAFYFAISGVVYFYNKKAGIAFFIASFLIGLARVFCGVHWPMDIVAGFFVGIFSSYLIIKLWKLEK